MASEFVQTGWVCDCAYHERWEGTGGYQPVCPGGQGTPQPVYRRSGPAVEPINATAHQQAVEARLSEIADLLKDIGLLLIRSYDLAVHEHVAGRDHAHPVEEVEVVDPAEPDHER